MIRVERDGAVTLVTIDRPAVRNALDHTALAGLLDAVEGAAGDGTRALVLTGAGGHFCAGADLSGVRDPAFTELLAQVLAAMTSAPLPLVAAVDGAALGLGTQLAVACDVRMATPAARFGIPAGRLGLMVDHWTVHRLSLVAGHALARAMLLAAETVDGETAARSGLVTRLGDLGAARAWATEIAALAPLSVAGHKRSLEVVAEATEAPPDVVGAFLAAWASDDLTEGMAAFRERRPARFRGR